MGVGTITLRPSPWDVPHGKETRGDEPNTAPRRIHTVRGFSFFAMSGKVGCMVVRMRHTRAHTANRRSHHALKDRTLATCECGAIRVSHRACPSCGRYNGRVVVNKVKKVEAKAAKKRAKVSAKTEAVK